MENASKALIIAGAILIAVFLMSLFIMFFNYIRDFNTEQDDKKIEEEARNWNRFFEESLYDVDVSTPGNQVFGYDVYNIALKAYELNRSSYEGYVIEVIYNNTVIVSDSTRYNDVKGNLDSDSIGLNYDNLQYDTGVDEGKRNTAIAKFSDKYTIDKFEYGVDGRISKIYISH